MRRLRDQDGPETTLTYSQAPNQPSTCGTQIPAGLSGRILAIQGRNVNNTLTFTYPWANGDASNPENLTQIVVAHSDGQSVTLTFGLLNGTGPDELQAITRPDGAVVAYVYDPSGDLLEVDRPGNNTTSAPNCIPDPNRNPLVTLIESTEPAALDRACARAAHFGNFSLDALRTIIAKRLYTFPLDDLTPAPVSPPAIAIVRPLAAYAELLGGITC